MGGKFDKVDFYLHTHLQPTASKFSTQADENGIMCYIFFLLLEIEEASQKEDGNGGQAVE